MMRSSLLSSAVLASAAILPAQLAGNYTVGPGGSYPDLTAAITALTTAGVVGPVTMTVTASQNGQWTLGSIPGQGPTNPVVFDGQGTIALAGTQPVLTLNGCANVTIQGFSGTFTSATNAIVVTGSTADCTFRNVDFTAPSSTSGAALINFSGGSGIRIEESRFGGSYEALNSGLLNTTSTVERCRITGGGFWIMRLAGADFTLKNNFITGSSNYGISCGVSGQPSSAANLKILHNSIYIAHTSAGSQYCSLRWYSNAAGTEVLNNVLYDAYPGTTGSPFNMWCSGSYRPVTMNFNCFHSNLASWFPVYAGANRTLAAWQGLGFDANSIQGDPLYVAPTTTPADLDLQAGSPCATAGTLSLDALTDHYLAARTVPVSIGAHEEDSGAIYSVFGPGCAGTAGVPTNTATPALRIGQTSTVAFGNLPAPQIAVAILGVSNTVGGFGPLPLDLGVLGAPGCFLRVSLDATLGLAGSGGVASFVWPVPNLPNLVGFTLHTQAAVLDPTLNAFGFSTSNAATAVVGL